MNSIKVKLPFTDIEIEQLADGHPVTDAADFLQSTIISNTRQGNLNALELGSGNGIISFMLALQRPNWQVTGIELQKELSDLAERNNTQLGLSCSFISGDLREHKTLLRFQGYELVFSNPPWIKAGAGQVSPDKTRAISRQEISCTMSDILACIDWCLSTEGSAWIIYPQQRKGELARELAKMKMEVSRLFEAEENPLYFIAKLRRTQASNHW